MTADFASRGWLARGKKFILFRSTERDLGLNFASVTGPRLFQRLLRG